jgi:SSS family solute:Na+ symporter
MGLFWKQATARAALWTAIVTIPAGILIKLIFPEMPFILRMGYVFIILVLVATFISLLDKRKIEGTLPEPSKARAFNTAGWSLLLLGSLSFLLGILYVNKLWKLGFDSIFMLATGLAFAGMIFILNANMKKVDPKSLEIDPELFKTGPAFTVGAIGIVLIVGSLYYFFW